MRELKSSTLLKAAALSALVFASQRVAAPGELVLDAATGMCAVVLVWGFAKHQNNESWARLLGPQDPR